MKQFSIHSIIRKGAYIMLIILSIIFMCILTFVSVIFAKSSGLPEPYRDEDGNTLAGSLSEKIYININGLEQGMFIKSKDITNPVLLYLHGGLPDYFLTKKYPTGLEDIFTVVWWEQRGSGMSYSSKIPSETMTLEQMISDTKELTNYLRQRFRQDKIYLMGRSGGTFLGMHVASQAPELYHAYLALAQISNQLQSECMAYEYMLTQFQEKENEKMLRKLKAAPVSIKSGISGKYLSVRDEAMHLLGVGTTRDMKSILTGIFLPSITCKDYTVSEKIKMWRGKSQAGVSTLWGTILATDLGKQVPELKIPVYFFHGIHDYTVSYSLAQAYFNLLKAPVKRFYTFEQSAHSPNFEEPEKMKQIFQSDILNEMNKLSDIK